MRPWVKDELADSDANNSTSSSSKTTTLSVRQEKKDDQNAKGIAEDENEEYYPVGFHITQRSRDKIELFILYKTGEIERYNWNRINSLNELNYIERFAPIFHDARFLLTKKELPRTAIVIGTHGVLQVLSLFISFVYLSLIYI